MDAEAHYRAWCERWGDVYGTEEERLAAYRDAKANLAALTEVADQLRDEEQESS